MRDGNGRPQDVLQSELLWALGSICALHRLPFAGELVEREFPPPCTHATLIAAGRALALRIRHIRLSALKTLLERAERVRTQQRFDKNKLYALHAPEVEWIGKGKARKPYEFGRVGQLGRHAQASPATH